MEIIIQHTDAIYRNYIIGLIIILVITSIPAIKALIKCKYEFKEYEFKYKLLWIIPVAFFMIDFFVSGLYVIDYAFDRTDVQTVLVEEVDWGNASYYLITENQKFHISRKKYDERNESYVIEEKVEGHWCEIESYKASNNVIRVKVLD